MARPRKDSIGPSAHERILEAFWSLLAEMPYSEVTVSALIRRASVSPNTLYYHFDGYDAVVQTALDETLDPRIFALVIGEGQSSSKELPKDVRTRFKRVVLFANDESGKLPAVLRSTLKQVWLEEMSLHLSDLTPLENIELDFIFAGVVSLLANMSAGNGEMDLKSVREIFQRPLGKGILGTLEVLRGREAMPIPTPYNSAVS